MSVLDTLQPQFKNIVGKVLAECSALGVEMRAYHGLRTPVEQAKFYRQSRATADVKAAADRLIRSGAPYLAKVLLEVGPQFGKLGAHITNALPGQSYHQFALAVDCVWVIKGHSEWSTSKKVTLTDGRQMNGYRLYTHIAHSMGLGASGMWKGRLREWAHIQQSTRRVLQDLTWPQINKIMEDKFSAG